MKNKETQTKRLTLDKFNYLRGDRPKLSILLPGIRSNMWSQLYQSILASCTYTSFELIIVSPHPLPYMFYNYFNVKYVKDNGNPVRAFNIAAQLAEGEIITWATDDGKFIANGIDLVLEFFEKLGEDKKNVLVWKYTEGGKSYIDEYFKINFHQGPDGEGIASKYLPDNYYAFTTVMMYREFFEEIGGFSSSYEATAMALNDFGIRAQHLGANVELFNLLPIFACSQQEDTTGDHGPVHSAQVQNDEPHYNKLYKQKDWENRVELKIDLSTEWKKSPPVWFRKYEEKFKTATLLRIKEEKEHKFMYFGLEAPFSYGPIAIVLSPTPPAK